MFFSLILYDTKIWLKWICYCTYPFALKHHWNIIIEILGLVIYNAVNNGWMLIYNFDLGGNMI